MAVRFLDFDGRDTGTNCPQRASESTLSTGGTLTNTVRVTWNDTRSQDRILAALKGMRLEFERRALTIGAAQS